MTLLLNTASGRTLELGTPPSTNTPCDFCGGAAQLLSIGEQDGSRPWRIATCVPCLEDALRVARQMADTPGAPGS